MWGNYSYFCVMHIPQDVPKHLLPQLTTSCNHCVGEECGLTTEPSMWMSTKHKAVGLPLSITVFPNTFPPALSQFYELWPIYLIISNFTTNKKGMIHRLGCTRLSFFFFFWLSKQPFSPLDHICFL